MFLVRLQPKATHSLDSYNILEKQIEETEALENDHGQERDQKPGC